MKNFPFVSCSRESSRLTSKAKKCEESWFYPAPVEADESFSVARWQDEAQFEYVLNWSVQRCQAQEATEYETDWICIN